MCSITEHKTLLHDRYTKQVKTLTTLYTKRIEVQIQTFLTYILLLIDVTYITKRALIARSFNRSCAHLQVDLLRSSRA